MKQGKPLHRRTPLRRGDGGLKRTPFERKPELRAVEGDKPVKPAKRRQSNSPAIPTKLRTQVLKRDDYHCVRCGRDITNGDYSLQHRDPRGAGGSRYANTMANLVTLCGSATTLCHGHVESAHDAGRVKGRTGGAHHAGGREVPVAQRRAAGGHGLRDGR